jgi:hypothetical protein
MRALHGVLLMLAAMQLFSGFLWFRYFLAKEAAEEDEDLKVL